MWGWMFVLLTFAFFLYIYFLKRQIRQLKQEIKNVPDRSSFGGRLYLDFREQTLLELVDELNEMIDHFEEKNRQAKQMEENVKLSIAGLSHDLRTPLTAVNGYIQLLQATSDETKRANYYQVIEQSVNRLLDMTDQFYELARIETNQKEVELTSITLNKVVEETFLSFYEQFEEKNIDLDFPENYRETTVVADQLMLRRVIQNLIQNIIRYAERKAEIRFEYEKDFIVLIVKNDIKPNSKVAIDKVFMRFYTEVSSRINTESSGLGLYISKKLVEKMNGRMAARLEDQKFIIEIYLPLNRA